MLNVVDAACFWVGPEVAGEALCDAAGGEDAPFELEFGHGWVLLVVSWDGEKVRLVEKEIKRNVKVRR